MMFATDVALICESDPGTFTDIETKEDAQFAITLCQACEFLSKCQDYAGRFRWQDHIVIAGWQAPRTKPTYPPWSPQAKR